MKPRRLWVCGFIGWACVVNVLAVPSNKGSIRDSKRADFNRFVQKAGELYRGEILTKAEMRVLTQQISEQMATMNERTAEFLEKDPQNGMMITSKFLDNDPKTKLNALLFLLKEAPYEMELNLKVFQVLELECDSSSRGKRRDDLEALKDRLEKHLHKLAEITQMYIEDTDN